MLESRRSHPAPRALAAVTAVTAVMLISAVAHARCPQSPYDDGCWEGRFQFAGLGLATGQVDTATETGLAFGVSLLKQRRFSTGLEVELMAAQDPYDGVERSSHGLMLPARFYLWDAFMTPFLVVAGGIEFAQIRNWAFTEGATRLVGKFGGGVELRFGEFLAFEAAVQGVAKMRPVDHVHDHPPASYAPVPELPKLLGATEVRLGFALRF